MMENKYYTPTIEEFHVGFEYEIYEDFDTYSEKSWHPQVYGRNGADPESIGYISYGLLSAKEVRVRYLDHDDIIELGWEPSDDNPNEWFSSYKGDHLLQLEFNNGDDSIVIFNYQRSTGAQFAGTVKNKSELKRLMQQLGI